LVTHWAVILPESSSFLTPRVHATARGQNYWRASKQLDSKQSQNLAPARPESLALAQTAGAHPNEARSGNLPVKPSSNRAAHNFRDCEIR
jgi:hypothetical protein